jgi:hypothetical protein
LQLRLHGGLQPSEVGILRNIDYLGACVGKVGDCAGLDVRLIRPGEKYGAPSGLCRVEALRTLGCVTRHATGAGPRTRCFNAVGGRSEFSSRRSRVVGVLG